MHKLQNYYSRVSVEQGHQERLDKCTDNPMLLNDRTTDQLNSFTGSL